MPEKLPSNRSLRTYSTASFRQINRYLRRTEIKPEDKELFGRLKDYLARNGLKQKDFILGLIERELNDAESEE